MNISASALSINFLKLVNIAYKIMQYGCKFYFDGDTANLKNMVKFCVPTWLVLAGSVTYTTESPILTAEN